MVNGRMAWGLFILGACLVALSMGMGGMPMGSPCWRLETIRQPAVGERAFTDHDPYLREPDDPNSVPGPAGSRLVVRKDAQRRPVLYLERSPDSAKVVLRRATGPRMSPGGRYVACVVWRSIQRPWTLVIADLTTGRSFEPPLDGCSTPFEWSPDGKQLAVMVTPCQAPRARLAIVRIPSGRVLWVDSLDVFADYEFAWSPDSRWLAVVRPTSVDRETEEALAADVWILSATGPRCRLSTPQFVEHGPRWIDDRTLLIDRHRVNGTKLGEAERVVYRLAKEARP